ncbi:MAG: ATP-binding protein, partial [Acidobacteria bacterium]|nr:ATP-binding protein [Acidobacteriota bacterium]
MAGLKKAGSNWVDGDRFFDRDGELDVLRARVQNGTHTLLTAQRRMGKTSLIRELLRRLRAEGRFETVFVDLEDVRTAADAVVEIGVESRHVHGAFDRIKSLFANVLHGIGDRIDELAVAEVRVKLRAGIDAGNWRQKGDAVCAA